MSEAPAPLVHVAALSRLLLDALGRLDRELAPEAWVAELRGVCERSHAELERLARARADDLGADPGEPG